MMTRDEFYAIVKSEDLNIYNIGDSKTIFRSPFTYGCVKKGSNWMVYETDERGYLHEISIEDTETRGLETLLNRLRRKKKVDDLRKKTNSL